MGQRFPSISDRHRVFIEAQRIFFVASAAPEGRINVSPKGMGTFRVLGPNEVAYLDCTGSGSETRAHLVASEDKRLTVMFCAFEGSPLILRLYGQGQSCMRGTPEYGALLRHFDEIPGARGSQCRCPCNRGTPPRPSRARAASPCPSARR